MSDQKTTCPKCGSPRSCVVNSFAYYDCGSKDVTGNGLGGGFVESYKCGFLSKINELEQENERLRAALATSKDPCIYCQLPREEMAKCKSGFPGCGRADDMMGCPEFGASMEVERLQATIKALVDELRKQRQGWELIESADGYFVSTAKRHIESATMAMAKGGEK